MTREFDMEIGDLGGGFLADGGAVEQGFGGDQCAIEIERVIGREKKVAMRDVIGQRACLDADRVGLFGMRVTAQRKGAKTEPLDRRGAAVMEDYAIIEVKVFNRDFAARGEDFCAFGEAGQGVEGDGGVGGWVDHVEIGGGKIAGDVDCDGAGAVAELEAGAGEKCVAGGAEAVEDQGVALGEAGDRRAGEAGIGAGDGAVEPGSKARV